MSYKTLRVANLFLKEGNKIYQPDCLVPKDGKTIYEYAKDGGFQGSEKDFISVFCSYIDRYPVGSIYISGTNTSPAQLFGGDWEQITESFLLSSSLINKSTGQSDGNYNVDLKKHGEEFVTLSTNEMPKHRHTVYGSTSTAGWYWYNGIIYKNPGNTYSTSETGGGQSHNNMPPYIVKYIWRKKG